MNTTIPSDYLYTKDHEWIKINDDTALIGITDFAQSSLGDIVFLELPEIGTQLEPQQSIGVVESIKSVSDIYSPLAGKVIEVNHELQDKPEQCNEAPYESWLIKIRFEGEITQFDLMDAVAYEEFTQQSH